MKRQKVGGHNVPIAAGGDGRDHPGAFSDCVICFPPARHKAALKSIAAGGHHNPECIDNTCGCAKAMAADALAEEK